jgi:hypothetical protein
MKLESSSILPFFKSMASTNTIYNAADPANPIVQVLLQQVIQLTSTNYISWKSQMEATLIGYPLYSYVNGKLPVPPETISTPGADATDPPIITSNPAYDTFVRQDKLIFAAISGTLSPSLAPLVSRCSTSLEAWNVLAKTYANPSKGHLKQIKERLRHITKGSKTITEFMGEIKTFVINWPRSEDH